MGVSDELAALRSKGTVKQHANALKSKSGSLSTPEAEEASLAKLKKEDRTKKAQAEELLRKTNAAGGGLVDEELKKVGDRKKMFEKGRVEAKTLLNKGASGGAPVGKVDVSSSNEEAKKEAAPAKEVAAEAPKAAPQAQDANTEVDDIPQLEDDDVPDLEEALAEAANTETATPDATHTTNRNEKKVRKMMARLDMRPLPGIARAVFKTASGNFFIESPDVYAPTKSNGDTFSNVVIFGEARQQQSPMAYQRNAAQAVESMRQNAAAESSVDDDVKGVVEEDVVNVEGLDAKDIELVMAQASVEKGVAVKALRENDGDLVNAIMSLTT